MTRSKWQPPKQCPTCGHHFPRYLFVKVWQDVMGDARATVEVCRRCARHSLPGEASQ